MTTSTPLPDTPPVQRQTTVLFGGSNGSATLCSILGDQSNPANAGHVVRLVTRNPSRFLDERTGKPLEWRCNEQKPLTDLIPTKLLPKSWVTHVGAPSSVFSYDRDAATDHRQKRDSGAKSIDLEKADDASNDKTKVSSYYTSVERALSGIDCPDDGGVADIIILACPVNAHLAILRQIARALYRLNADRALLSRKAPPLMIGTMYAAGGFDWMCRIAFALERRPDFNGYWTRQLGLFGMRSFPYLCKSTERGVVTLYGRFPQLAAAISPSTPRVRAHCKRLLHRVLQSESTGKYLTFIGLSSAVKEGGDGAGVLADKKLFIGEGNDVSQQLHQQRARNNVAIGGAALAFAAASTTSKTVGVQAKADKAARVAAVAAPATHGPSRTFAPLYGARPTDSIQLGTAENGLVADVDDFLHDSPIMSDIADPYASLAFLSCTLNATNQFLHPCIMAALFNKSDKNGMGIVDNWDKTKRSTSLPRFYADGARNPEAGRLIVAIAVGEIYPLMTLLDRILSPNGLLPISAQHGGEPLGRFFLTETRNHPTDVLQRSGLADIVLGRSTNPAGHERKGKTTNEKVRYNRVFSFLMSFMLSRNIRLSGVLAPAEKDEKTGIIRPKVKTRFFVDDVPHGLCLALGLGELLGFDLEKDMPETLGLVRKLQRWMGKEFVLQSSEGTSKGIVSGARDLASTSAPQAFGVANVADLRDFLMQSPFGDDAYNRLHAKLLDSSMFDREGVSRAKQQLRSRL